MNRPKYSGMEVAKILNKYGYKYYHTKGTHMVLKKKKNFVHVPFQEKVVKIGILKHIEKKTGVELL